MGRCGDGVAGAEAGAGLEGGGRPLEPGPHAVPPVPGDRGAGAGAGVGRGRRARLCVRADPQLLPLHARLASLRPRAPDLRPPGGPAVAAGHVDGDGRHTGPDGGDGVQGPGGADRGQSSLQRLQHGEGAALRPPLPGLRPRWPAGRGEGGGAHGDGSRDHAGETPPRGRAGDPEGYRLLAGVAEGQPRGRGRPRPSAGRAAAVGLQGAAAGIPADGGVPRHPAPVSGGPRVCGAWPGIGLR
mmetsp:Transcript_60098/g.107246  ORF Transcript_60098/g.107246 Transcript_60098/m.107246 type:complete len:242 (+) Transcript_60098:2100-2825(+)